MAIPVLIPSTVLGWLFAACHTRRTDDPIRLLADLEAQRDHMIEQAADLENDTLAAAADHLDRLVNVLRIETEVS